MKVKIGLLVIVFAIAMTLAGCGTTTPAPAPEVPNPDENVEQPVEAVGYEVVKKLAENADNNSKINYPQITGLTGELLMDYMNQTLAKINMMYGTSGTYEDVVIDYEITKMDKDILSILYTGTGKIVDGKQINIQTSVNLDIKTSNPIDFQNLVDTGSESQATVISMINQQAKDDGQKLGVEVERLQLYFDTDNIVFFYLPADENASEFINISIPKKELDGLINTSFGEKPAS